MYIPELQHIEYPGASVADESAMHYPLFRVFPSTEHQIPQWEPVVIRMEVGFVMNTVHFRARHDVTQPVRRSLVGMNEQVIEGGEEERPSGRISVAP